MTLNEINITHKVGRITLSGRDVINYFLAIPLVPDIEALNTLFTEVAKNYLKYLESLASTALLPELERLISENMRTRDIRSAIGIPIDARLHWKFSVFNGKYLSARCESTLEYSNGKRRFSLCSFTLDTERKIIVDAREFLKKPRRRDRFFYINDSRLYTYRKGCVFAESKAQSDAKMEISIRKIDKIMS